MYGVRLTDPRVTPILERELEKLGLSEKEAKVYLSALELGPQPVQDIARKAGVNRATTYVMIESLTKRGLMTSLERGKKRLFNAEQPDRLLSLIRMQTQQLQEQEREFAQYLPQLRAILAASGERPRVRFFEGPEAIRAIREEVIATDGDEMWVVAEHRADDDPLSPGEYQEYDRRLQEKRVRQYVLYTGRVLPEELQQHPMWEFRRIPEEQFPIHGEVSVLGHKIFASVHRGKFIGVIMESEELANILRSTIRLAWRGAQPPAASVSAKAGHS